MNNQHQKKIYRRYEQDDYSLIRKDPKDVRPGDLVLFNFNTPWEDIVEIIAMSDWNYTLAQSKAVRDGDFYVLQLETE